MASSYNQKSSSSASRQPKPTYRKGNRTAPVARPQRAGAASHAGAAVPRQAVPQRMGLSAHSPYAQPAAKKRRSAGAGAAAPARRSAAQAKQPKQPKPQMRPRAASGAGSASQRQGGALARRQQTMPVLRGRQSAPRPASSQGQAVPRGAAMPVNRAVRRPQALPSGGASAGRVPVGVNVPRSQPSAGVGSTRFAGAQPSGRAGSTRASDGLIKRIAKRRSGASSAPDVSAALKQRRRAGSEGAGARRAAGGGGAARVIAIVLGVVLALIVVGGVGFTFVANAGFFSADTVRLEATEHITDDELQKLVDLPEGTTLLNADAEAIADQLRQNPWVESVSIEREFPHTLVVTPVERKVFALVYISTGDITWAVDRSGTWIAPTALEAAGETGGSDGDADANGTAADADGSGTDADAADANNTDGAGTSTDDGDSADGSDADAGSGDDAENSGASSGYNAALELARHLGAVLVTDVGTDIDPQSGSTVADEGVSAALTYARGFSSEFLEQVRSISAASPEACALYLESGVEVSLGPADNVQDKETVVEKILAERSGVTYINVRDPENPTWREVTIQ